MSRFNRHVASALAVLALQLFFLADSAIAASSAVEVPSVTVQYHDLNLDSARGVATLYSRIRAAAAVVCESSDAPRPGRWLIWDARDVCVNQSVARAVQGVRSDKLSAYHMQQIRGWKHWSDRIETAWLR